MKISLVIPCTPNHFLNLRENLEKTMSGTSVPDEIVISLSNSNYVSSDLIKKMEEYLSEKVEKFALLKHYRKMPHGPNRQAGSEAASGDLLIYQDADDYPHPQRIEIMEYFFDNHDIVHLNHGWIPATIDFENLEKTNISYINPEDIYKQYFPNNNFSDCLGASNYGAGFVTTTGGHTSVLKKVLERVRWKDWDELIGRAEDYEFCMEVAYNFKKSMIIDAPLIQYTNIDFQHFSLSDLGYK